MTFTNLEVLRCFHFCALVTKWVAILTTNSFFCITSTFLFLCLRVLYIIDFLLPHHDYSDKYFQIGEYCFGASSEATRLHLTFNYKLSTTFYIFVILLFCRFGLMKKLKKKAFIFGAFLTFFEVSFLLVRERWLLAFQSFFEQCIIIRA